MVPQLPTCQARSTHWHNSDKAVYSDNQLLSLLDLRTAPQEEILKTWPKSKAKGVIGPREEPIDVALLNDHVVKIPFSCLCLYQ